MIKLSTAIILWTTIVSSPCIEQIKTKSLQTDKKIDISDSCTETIKKSQISLKGTEHLNEDPGTPEPDFNFFINRPVQNPSICNHEGFLYKKINLSDKSSETTSNQKITWNNLKLRNTPLWIRSRLILTLNSLNPEIADTFVKRLGFISEKEENRPYLDELFFVIAFSSPVELEQPEFSPEMILQSVKTLYNTSFELDYAEIVEKGNETTGELSTVSLKIKESGTIKSVELDPWIYYAFVVHPRLDSETLGFFSPSQNMLLDKNDGGTDFRTNFYYGEPVEESYSGHYIFRNDRNVDKEELKMPDGNFSCPVVITGNAADSLVLVESTNGPCMTETFTGSGNIVSLGLDMESIDSRDALTNFTSYGNGYCSVGEKIVLILENENSAGFLKDNIETYLHNYEFIILENFNEEVLFTKTENQGGTSYTLNAGKVIIPPSMSENFYRNISEMKTSFDTFASQGGSVMMFLFSKDGDPCAFDLPGGIKCSKNSDTTEDFKLSGHPVLREHLKNTGFYYEKEIEPYYLEGEEPLNKDASAIEKTGDWIGLNMQRNISEMNNTVEKVERAVQAVRVAYNHYGNCGENQDMSGAAMKTALIPVINVNNSAEDHVWNEIWTPDGWMPMQSAWSNYSQDYGTVGKICMEKKFDGGKDISYVYAWRGDHRFFNRTSTYTDIVKTNLKVVDSQGNGVPDAAVLIATENYYDNSQLTIAGSTSTDESGEATLITGDNRNIYIQIISNSLGVYPGVQQVEKIVNSQDAVSGSEFEYTAKFSKKLPAFPDTAVAEIDHQEGDTEATIDLAVSQFISHTNPFNEGAVYTSLENVSGKVHIFDETQFENFKKSGTANSYKTIETADLPATVSIYRDSIYYAVFVSDRLGYTAGEIIIEADTPKDDNDEESDNDSDYSSKSDGCSLTFI